MSQFERFVFALRKFVRLVKDLQVYALELVLVAAFFFGLYKFTVTLFR